MTIYFLKIKVALSTIIFVFMYLCLDFSLFTVMPLSAALFHEAAHLIILRYYKVETEKITIHPFGIDIRTISSLPSYKAELAVKSAGILMNLFLFLIALPFKSDIYMSFFGLSNLALLIINILPVKGLDGGSIAETLLLMKFEPDTADRIMYIMSMIFIFLMWIAAMYILMYTGYNFSLFAMTIYLFTGIIKSGTKSHSLHS